MANADVPSPGRRRRLGAKLLVLAGSLLVCLGVLEVALRMAGFGPAEGRLQYIGHADLELVPAPNQRILEGQDDPATGRIRYPVTINRYSQRGEDYALEKPVGELRIACVGDSLTFGPGVGDADIFTARLQALCREEPLAQGNVRVINASRNGWATIHYLRWVETQMASFDPDVVVVCCFLGNDMGIPVLSSRSIPVPLENVLRHSAIGDWLSATYRMRRAKRDLAWQTNRPFEDITEDDLKQFAGINDSKLTFEEKLALWRHSLEHFERMRDVAAEQGVRLVTLLIPTSWNVTKIEPIPRWLQNQLEARGISTILPNDELSVLGREAWLPYDLGHLTPLGHEAVAKALLRGLRQLAALD